MNINQVGKELYDNFDKIDSDIFFLFSNECIMVCEIGFQKSTGNYYINPSEERLLLNNTLRREQYNFEKTDTGYIGKPKNDYLSDYYNLTVKIEIRK